MYKKISEIKSGFVVSDLHIFARRSSIDMHMEEMHAAIAEADFFVLNGDIFDFRWSIVGGLEKTIDAAAVWIKELSARHSHCEIHYVLGNHDAIASFVTRLEKLSSEIENFFWHPTHLQIGKSLYIHGDLPLSGKNPLERKFKKYERVKGKSMNVLYDSVVKVRGHRLLDVTGAKKRCARKILKSFAKHGREGALDGITDIYFGHTHVGFSDFSYQNFTFHNTGAAICGVKINMLECSSSLCRSNLKNL